MPETPNERATTVIWLLPADPERDVLRRLVTRLAEECDAPIFEPHLTLGHGTPEMLAGINQAPIRLRVTGVTFSPQFTKTLFVRLEYSASLRALRRSLGIEITGAFDPHLSVLYRRLPETRRIQLADAIKLPFASVPFDAIAVIRCRVPTASRADVEGWKILATQKLR